MNKGIKGYHNMGNVNKKHKTCGFMFRCKLIVWYRGFSGCIPIEKQIGTLKPVSHETESYKDIM